MKREIFSLSLVIFMMVVCTTYVVNAQTKTQQRFQEGEVISLPVIVPATELLSGEWKNVKFLENEPVKVKLKNGRVVEAYATKEQMKEMLKRK